MQAEGYVHSTQVCKKTVIALILTHIKHESLQRTKTSWQQTKLAAAREKEVVTNHLLDDRLTVLEIDDCIYWPPRDSASTLKYDPHSDHTTSLVIVSERFGNQSYDWCSEGGVGVGS